MTDTTDTTGAPSYSHAEIRAILERVRTIAAVGVSLNEVRPSYYVTRQRKVISAALRRA